MRRHGSCEKRQVVVRGCMYFCGCEGFWVVVCGFGWLYVVLGGCEGLWMVVSGCERLKVVLCGFLWF